MALRIETWRIFGASSDVSLLSVEIADTFSARFFGLMGRASIAPGRGLFLSPCSSVHMCFMRFAIDVAYVARARGAEGEGWRVVKIARRLRPWIGLSACPGADAALELAAGEAERLGLETGMILERTGGGFR